MMHRFTDSARSAVRNAFRRQPAAREQEVVTALAAQRRGLARVLLGQAGIVADELPPDTPPIERRVLVAEAGAEAQRRGVRYVGTEHVLLALARLPNSALPVRGASAEQLDSALSAIEIEWGRAHPTVARRVGAALRTILVRLRGRA